MSPVLMRAPDLVPALGEAVPVAEPIGDIVAAVRVARAYGVRAGTSSGLWECTPGRWVRQIRQAEFCYFTEGELIFEPDDGEPIHIKAGDAIFFPPNSTGVWDIKTRTRKMYLMFNEQVSEAPAE